MKRTPHSVFLLLATVLASAMAAPAQEASFETLFDGSGLEGWEHKGNWFVDEDGALARKGKGGSIVYRARPVPDDFEVRFEWKVAVGSNSGVYYRPTQYEYQILDNAVHKDGGNPRTSAASLYFCMQPSRDATKPVGEWNEGRIVCKGTVVQHWLNGEKVLADKPVALLDNAPSKAGKAHILQLNALAHTAGLSPGMTATQGQARCPELHLLDRSPEDEKTARRLLLACAASHAPDIEDTAPGICTLDLLAFNHGPLAKLGDLCLPDRFEELGGRIRTALANSGFEARVGVAENPDLALLAARLAKNTLVIRAERDEIGRFLSPLPIEAVEPSAELLAVLELWGIHTLGDLTTLPGQEVVERLGPEAARLWEQATGGRRRLLRIVRPRADYSREVELEHAIETLEPLLFLIRRMLENIAARLAAAYRVAEEITLRLTLDDGAMHRRRFRVPDPSRDVDLLFRMLHTYLEGVTTEAPVTALRLTALPVRPGASQFHLFESSLRDPNRFAETMACLEALLGSDRVGTPSLLPTHRADRFTLEPFAGKTEAPPATPAKKKKKDTPAPPPVPLALGLPLRRFRPPLPVKVLTHYDPTHAVERPRELHSRDLSGRLLQRRGPWLGSGDWWDRDSWSREEWDVQLEDGALYRLVREDHHWLVEGVYG